jgi:hypothetical protein
MSAWEPINAYPYDPDAHPNPWVIVGKWHAAELQWCCKARIKDAKWISSAGQEIIPPTHFQGIWPPADIQ